MREISIERGYHPKDFAVLAFGGGGAFVAASVARELGIPKVIVPPGPANFSAFGMLMVDVVHDFSQTYVMGLENIDINTVNDIYANLLAEGQAALARDGFSDEQRAFIPSAQMRYQGQEHPVNLPMPGHKLQAAEIDGIVEAFNAAHQRQYGHSMADPVEIVTLRLRAVGLLSRPDIPKIEPGTGNVDRARKGSRSVYRHELGQRVEYLVYDRGHLSSADRLEGPAIIEEPSSTTVIHAGDVLTVGEYGELVIDTALNTTGDDDE